MAPKRGSSSTIRMTGSPGEMASRSSAMVSMVSTCSSSEAVRTVTAREASRAVGPVAAAGVKFSGRNRVKVEP